MSAESLEALLARILVDAEARRRFRADPRGEAVRAGLSDEDALALGAIDWVGLDLAASSLANKRAHADRTRPAPTLLRRWFRRRW